MIKFLISKEEAQQVVDYLVTKPINEALYLVQIFQNLETTEVCADEPEQDLRDIHKAELK